MELSKATITILPSDASAAGSGGRLSQTTFKVQFNPTEYTINKAVQIAEIAIPGLDEPILQFVRGQNEKLTMDLFFDTTISDPAHPDQDSYDIWSGRAFGDASSYLNHFTEFFNWEHWWWYNEPQNHGCGDLCGCRDGD